MEVTQNSLLKRFNCNYLQSGITRDGFIAFIDEDHLKIFHYSFQSHHLTPKKSIPISRHLQIKALTWGPPHSRYSHFLCYCTDEVVEICEIFGTSSKRITHSRAHITSIVWTEDNDRSSIFLTSTSGVRRIDISLEDECNVIPIISFSIGLVSIFTPTTQNIIYFHKKTLAGSSLCIRPVASPATAAAVSVSGSNPQTRSQEINLYPTDTFTLRGLSHCSDDIFIATSEQEVQIQSSASTARVPSDEIPPPEFPLLTPQSGLLISAALPSKIISIISSTSEDNLEIETQEDLSSNSSSFKKKAQNVGPFPHALPENGRSLQEILSVTATSQGDENLSPAATIRSLSSSSGIINSLFSISSSLQESNLKLPSCSSSTAEASFPLLQPPLLSIVTRNEDSSFHLSSSIPLTFASAEGSNATLNRPDVVSSFLHTRPGGLPSQIWIAVGSSASNSVLIYTLPMSLLLLGEASCASSHLQQPHQIYTLPSQVALLFLSPSSYLLPSSSRSLTIPESLQGFVPPEVAPLRGNPSLHSLRNSCRHISGLLFSSPTPISSFPPPLSLSHYTLSLLFPSQTSVSAFLRYRTALHTTLLLSPPQSPQPLPFPPLRSVSPPNGFDRSVLLAIGELRSFIEVLPHPLPLSLSSFCSDLFDHPCQERFDSIENRLAKQEKEILEVQKRLDSFAKPLPP